MNEDPPQAEKGRRKAVFFLAAGLGAAAASRLAPAHAASIYGGGCYKCACCLFEGVVNECGNCGHSYADHSRSTCLSGHGPAR
jgi:hypothetical protein